jgi:hypothetical protein
MRNYKKYRSTVIDLFQSFLAGKIEKRELIFALKEIDKEIRKNPKTLKGLWFKFFKVDTGATTIKDLSNSIDCNTNREHIIDCMQIAIDNPKGFQIYYS